PCCRSPHSAHGRTQMTNGARKPSGTGSLLCGIKPSCNGIVPGVTSSRPGGIGETQPGLAEAVCQLPSVGPEDTREFGKAMRGVRHKATGMGKDIAGPRICVDCTVQHELDGRSMPS